MKKICFLFKKIAFCCLFAVALTACESDNDSPSITLPPGANGVFILNQGGYNTNDASVSFYDFDSGVLERDIANGGLGATGQDLLIYGSKLYVSMTGSSYIAVFDVETRRLLKNIHLLGEDGAPREPRYLESHGGKIYVSCWDRANGGSVLRIDTLNFAVEARAQAGEFPEGIAISGGKLYVANSGGQSQTGFDNTVSVIDLLTFTETERISVGTNPYIIKADGRGNLFLTYQGNWYDIPGGFQRINTASGTVTDLGTSPKQDFLLLNGFVYFYDVDYTISDTGEKRYGKYDTQSNTFDFAFIKNPKKIRATPYGIGINPRNGDIYIADSDWFNPGTITIFDATGQFKHALTDVGMNPCKFAFY